MARHTMPLHHITDRQREIARAIAFGEKPRQVAERLCVGEHTIHKVLSDLYLETGTCSQAGLTGWCLVHGIVTLAELEEVYGRGG